MKLIIEDSDIQEVKKVLENYYGIFLTESQIEDLINDNYDLCWSLYMEGHIDTESRGLLGDIVVGWVLEDSPPPKHKGYLGYGPNGKIKDTRWTYPNKNSSEQYNEEFYVSFLKAALEKGITLGGAWEWISK